MKVLITRHEATKQLFRELNIIDGNTLILDHIDKSNIHLIKNKDVIGILPLDLAVQCKSSTSPIWDIPLEARGNEWEYEEIKRYFKGMKKYEVREVV